MSSRDGGELIPGRDGGRGPDVVGKGGSCPHALPGGSVVGLRSQTEELEPYLRLEKEPRGGWRLSWGRAVLLSLQILSVQYLLLFKVLQLFSLSGERRR